MPFFPGLFLRAKNVEMTDKWVVIVVALIGLGYPLLAVSPADLARELNLEVCRLRLGRVEIFGGEHMRDSHSVLLLFVVHLFLAILSVSLYTTVECLLGISPFG